MYRSLIYVSRRALATPDLDAAVDEIVATARSRNAALDVTGALACTSDHFAQILEGPSAAIDALMQSIEDDPRHTDVTILDVGSIRQRKIPDWSMAYSGASTYIARQIEALLIDPDAGAGARIARLRSLLVGFAAADPAAAF